ncbi:GNAT family N-acetyltransferase [Clostridium sp.]|uniref:GNAT family N-acetyltransferase n=1 Tax=Clostridium sp. TaxID=1506 RepID=UPI001A3CD877|nr:GNAT family N-acetyltransferase [Clostridium sp.]MBK5240521.1 GNAT family N-acetyltransferase [Clostridium sp.]
MDKSINLTLKNINIFREINKFNSNFSLSNKDFFQEYDNSNVIQKLFLRKNVNLLIEENKYIGYIWFERHNKNYSSINSINVIGDNNLNYYKTLIKPLENNSLITYESEDNEINMEILSRLGFKKDKGFVELEKKCTEQYNIVESNNIKFSIVVKDKDEKSRCLLQNEIFKNNDRIPINIEDIYYDEAQEYYFDKGAIFIELNNVPIGYGQIIIEDNMAILVNFGIVEKFRKEGYGKLFLSYLINLAIDNDFSSISLKVDSNNESALKLYHSQGFNTKRTLYTWQKTKIL